MRYKPLTPRQKEIYNTIKQFIKIYGYAPTYRDIAEREKISVKGAYDHVKALERKVALRMTKNIARSIVLEKII